MTSLRLILLSVLALIQGCGGGGGGGDGGGGGGDDGGGGGGPTAPGVFSANVQFDTATQRFVATWNASSGAERYRIHLKRDEVADFALLDGADNLSAMTLDFSFAIGFTIQWSAAALRVEACNAVGCTSAADLPLLPHLADALARKEILNLPADGGEPQVAISADGNTLVIGSPLQNGDDGLQFDKGVVYVLTRAGTTWTAPAVLRAANGEGGSAPDVLGDGFGQAVALSADGATLVVGAPLEDGSRTSTVEDENNDAPNAGVVYIFVRNGTSYELQTYLKPTPGLLDTAITGIASVVRLRLQPTVRPWWSAHRWPREASGPAVSMTAPHTSSRATALHGRNARYSAGPMPMAMTAISSGGRWRCPPTARHSPSARPLTTVTRRAPRKTRTPTLRCPVPRTSSRPRIACSGCVRRT